MTVNNNKTSIWNTSPLRFSVSQLQAMQDEACISQVTIPQLNLQHHKERHASSLASSHLTLISAAGHTLVASCTYWHELTVPSPPSKEASLKAMLPGEH